jgi:predicted ThiF/HesA family dinucleotide-utilizing enzyme
MDAVEMARQVEALREIADENIETELVRRVEAITVLGNDTLPALIVDEVTKALEGLGRQRYLSSSAGESDIRSESSQCLICLGLAL